MLLHSIALATLLAPLPAPIAGTNTPSSTTVTAPAVRADHGKLTWFEGSFDALLAEAKKSNKLVFIDFWTTWCVWCKRLDADTFSDDGVAAEMKDVLCYSVDAESETGKPIAQRFRVQGYPALILLSPDGSARDTIGGYLTPDKFKEEIQRVRADKGTIGDMRRQAAADPSNIDLHDKLMQKLESLGDSEGAAAVKERIAKLDPDSKSFPMRRVAFDKVMSDINDGWNKSQTLDVDKVVAFLEKETYPDILFQGWFSVYKMHGFLAQAAAKKGDMEESKRHELEGNKAMRLIWKNCPQKEQGNLGPQIALDYFERRDKVTAEDRAFALEVAKGAQAAAPDVSATVGALACCLFMNGSKDEAIKHMQHAIELEPTNEKWKAYLTQFQAG